MSTAELILAAVTTIIGGLIGLAVSYYFFRVGGAARLKVVTGLDEVARIDPATIGVQVKMKIGTTDISNLLVLEVSVENRGAKDLVIEGADDPAQHDLRPRIELPEGFRALADPWNPDGARPEADVRLARQLRDSRQVFYVHIHRLARGATVRARIVCTQKGEQNSGQIVDTSMQFSPGFFPDVDIKPAGLLEKARQ
ncbi:hypothetical protein MUY14_30320 [Amycolatopsis sp. FBCC-B4732]|uniref:hypothetical protein n=1 Tax=Amycolatopsis sp. FBCC-B4732 TaxID=3079339 RepID=UPI001FF63DEE|nr:hypothetical protein [Amycolatopsis sp. FBCC-B4732]UOX86049.1 hypothetical protein MUY14_30320 [Amycolatopsis sp. FBCC-B4732]